MPPSPEEREEILHFGPERGRPHGRRADRGWIRLYVRRRHARAAEPRRNDVEEPGLKAVRGIVGLDEGDDAVPFVTGCELLEQHGLSGAAQAHQRGVDPRLGSG